MSEILARHSIPSSSKEEGIRGEQKILIKNKFSQSVLLVKKEKKTHAHQKEAIKYNNKNY